jgi:hypothetical protein
MSRIKGVAFREFLGHYATTYGKARIATVLAGLAPEQALTFDINREYLGVLPSTWYPAPVVHALIDGLTAGMSPKERDTLAVQAARAVMGSTLRGIYARLMELFVTPQIYARFAQTLWRSYYENGDFTVVIADAQTAECTIRGWQAHHPFICDLNREAATVIYEGMGLARVSTERTHCVARGDPHCRFITRWAR